MGYKLKNTKEIESQDEEKNGMQKPYTSIPHNPSHSHLPTHDFLSDSKN